MWNPNKVERMVTYINPHFVVTSFTSHALSWNLFNFYAPNTRNGRLVVSAETMREDKLCAWGTLTPFYIHWKNCRVLKTFLIVCKIWRDFLEGMT